MGTSGKSTSRALATVTVASLFACIFLGLGVWYSHWFSVLDPVYKDVVCNLDMFDTPPVSPQTLLALQKRGDVTFTLHLGMLCHNPNPYDILARGYSLGASYIGKEKLSVPSSATVPLTALLANSYGNVPIRVNMTVTQSLLAELAPVLQKEQFPFRTIVDFWLEINVHLPMRTWKVSQEFMKVCGANVCDLDLPDTVVSGRLNESVPTYSNLVCADSMSELMLSDCGDDHKLNRISLSGDLIVPSQLKDGEMARDLSLGSLMALYYFLTLSMLALVGFCGLRAWRPAKGVDTEDEFTDAESPSQDGVSDEGVSSARTDASRTPQPTGVHRPRSPQQSPQQQPPQGPGRQPSPPPPRPHRQTSAPVKPPPPRPCRVRSPDHKGPTLLAQSRPPAGATCDVDAFATAAKAAKSPEELRHVLKAVSSSDVSQADKQRFLRELQLRWHPDKNADNPEHAGEMFTTLSECRTWFRPTSVVEDQQQDAKGCPRCRLPLEWTDFAGGPYQNGWCCQKSRICHNTASKVGRWRWFCDNCQNDFCSTCYASMT